VLRSFDQDRKNGRIGSSAFGNKCFYAGAFLTHLRHRIPQGWSLTLKMPRIKKGIDSSIGKKQSKVNVKEEIRVELGGCRSALCLNINSYAAGAHPAPGSKRDDGLCEVVLLKSHFSAFLALGLSRLWPGALRFLSGFVPRWQAEEVVLHWTPEAKEKTALQIDGEDWTDRIPASGPWSLRPAGKLSILTLQD
jgi:hypothetical protein